MDRVYAYNNALGGLVLAKANFEIVNSIFANTSLGIAITSDANQALRLGNRQHTRVQPELGRRPGNRGALPRLLAGGDQEHAPRLGR